VVDTAMVPLGDRSGCWGFVELWRTSSPFTVAEVGLLATVPSVVTPALRRSVARTFAEQGVAWTASGPAVLMLDDELRVSGQTAAAARTLLELNPPDEPMPPVPAAAYNVGAALLAGPLGPSPESGEPPWSRVRVGGSSWLTVRASHLEARQIAVTIETCTPAERLDLYARACGLSASETAVLELLTLGLDNKAIATRRSVSEHTVHDQVKAVLTKAGVSTRQVLLARALGGS
jgi:DNA-binding CsgD family transcriptional regulator